jgi:hypothetical protein
MPFKSWQCITLSLRHRDFDLVIQNEADQNLFVKYILGKMRTVDGMKDSGVAAMESLLESQKKFHWWKNAREFSPEE